MCKSSIAAIIHIFYPENFPYFEEPIRKLSEYFPIYITTVNQNIRLFKQTLPENDNIQYIALSNVGRDLESLLIFTKNIITKYDYICFTHDKKSAHLHIERDAKIFFKSIIENTLPNIQYVNEVVGIFNTCPHIGLLSIPQPINGDYFFVQGNQWTCNLSNAQKLLKELDLTVVVDNEEVPLTLGTAFWFKSTAFDYVLSINWSKYLHPEPTLNDGDINHTIERIIPFILQEHGFLTGTISNKNYAQDYLSNIQYAYNSLVKLIKTETKNNDKSYMIFLNQVKSTIRSSLKIKLPSFYNIRRKRQ